MGGIAARLADVAVVTSDNPRTEDPNEIIRQIAAGMDGAKTPPTVIENRPKAIEWAMDHAEPGDVIVLCGKGHETYQEIGHEKRHLDDVKLLHRIWRERYERIDPQADRRLVRRQGQRPV